MKRMSYGEVAQHAQFMAQTLFSLSREKDAPGFVPATAFVYTDAEPIGLWLQTLLDQQMHDAVGGVIRSAVETSGGYAATFLSEGWSMSVGPGEQPMTRPRDAPNRREQLILFFEYEGYEPRCFCAPIENGELGEWDVATTFDSRFLPLLPTFSRMFKEA